jgi:molecular chaperone DnaK (HSP70)
MAVDLNAPASASTARKILSIDIGCGTFLLNFLKCMCDNLELISFVSKVIGGRDFTIATYECIMDLLRTEFEQAYRKNHPRAAQVDWNAFNSWINRMNEKESIMEAAENLKIRFCSSYAKDNVNFVEFRSRLPRNDYDIDSITITKEMLETRWKPLVEQIRRDCIAFVKQLIKDGHISSNGGDFTL